MRACQLICTDGESSSQGCSCLEERSARLRSLTLLHRYPHIQNQRPALTSQACEDSRCCGRFSSRACSTNGQAYKSLTSITVGTGFEGYFCSSKRSLAS